jgi:hypothetical protein
MIIENFLFLELLAHKITVQKLGTEWLQISDKLQYSALINLPDGELTANLTQISEASERKLSSRGPRRWQIAKWMLRIFGDTCTAVVSGNLSATPLQSFSILRHDVNHLKDERALRSFFAAMYGAKRFAAFTDVVVDTHTDTGETHEYPKERAKPCPLSTPWPTRVSDEMKLRCCKNYLDATNWMKAPCCAVCSRERHGAKTWEYQIEQDANRNALDGLEVLRVSGDFIRRYCIVHQLDAELVFGNDAINSLMLTKSGVHVDEQTHAATINVCNHCNSFLSRSPPTVPRLFLKNRLYRGRLPEFDSRFLLYMSIDFPRPPEPKESGMGARRRYRMDLLQGGRGRE